MTATVAEQFVDAFARRDRAALLALFTPGVDFRGMTPGRFWEASSPEQLVDEVLLDWLAEEDVVTEVLAVDRDWMVDREHVSYRFAVSTPDGPHVVEQQAYLMIEDGRIAWLRSMCSGFRKVDH